MIVCCTVHPGEPVQSPRVMLFLLLLSLLNPGNLHMEQDVSSNNNILLMFFNPFFEGYFFYAIKVLMLKTSILLQERGGGEQSRLFTQAGA
jgi:hypothetical protein